MTNLDPKSVTPIPALAIWGPFVTLVDKTRQFCFDFGEWRRDFSYKMFSTLGAFLLARTFAPSDNSA